MMMMITAATVTEPESAALMHTWLIHQHAMISVFTEKKAIEFVFLRVWVAGVALSTKLGLLLIQGKGREVNQLRELMQAIRTAQ